MATRLDPDTIRTALPASTVIGNKILVFEETDSTNDLVARAGEDGLPEGLVIFAEAQRAGRGTSGRKWLSPPYQNLLFSVLLSPVRAPVSRWPELTFCAALAVAEAAEELTGQEARIKWPNDVLLHNRKIAGILLESHHKTSPGFVVVGIGLNVLQHTEDFAPEIRPSAGSLAMAAEAGRLIERTRAAAAVLRRLNNHYLAWPEEFSVIMSACKERGCHAPTQAAGA